MVTTSQNQTFLIQLRESKKSRASLFAYSLNQIQAGASMKYIQERLGHGNMKSQQMYNYKSVKN